MVSKVQLAHVLSACYTLDLSKDFTNGDDAARLIRVYDEAFSSALRDEHCTFLAYNVQCFSVKTPFTAAQSSLLLPSNWKS